MTKFTTFCSVIRVDGVFVCEAEHAYCPEAAAANGGRQQIGPARRSRYVTSGRPQMARAGSYRNWKPEDCE